MAGFKFMHIIQKITLVVFCIDALVGFSASVWNKRKLTFGNFETSILPLILALYFIPRMNFWSTNHAVILIVGLVLYLMGMGLAFVAFWHLGFTNSDDFWFARKKSKKRYLVTSGPYTRIRHPIFVGLFLKFFAMVLTFFNLLTLGFFVVALIFGIYTEFQEEKFMQKLFPEYEKYKKGTNMFIPKIL